MGQSINRKNVVDEVYKEIEREQAKNDIPHLSQVLFQILGSKDPALISRLDGIDNMYYAAMISDMSAQSVTMGHAKDVSVIKAIIPGRKLIGPVLVIVKRLIRKLTFWLIEPAFEQQRDFNSAVANALERAIDLNAELVRENLELRRELAELKQKCSAHDGT